MESQKNTLPGLLSSLSDIISSIQHELAQWENDAAQASEQCDQLYEALLECGDAMNEASLQLRKDRAKTQSYIEKYQAAGKTYIHASRIYDAIQTKDASLIHIALDYIAADYQNAYRYHFGEPICDYCQSMYERALALTSDDVQAAKKKWDQARDDLYEHTFVTIRTSFDRFQEAKARHKQVMSAYDQANAQSARAAAQMSVLDKRHSILEQIWNAFIQRFEYQESKLQF